MFTTKITLKLFSLLMGTFTSLAVLYFTIGISKISASEGEKITICHKPNDPLQAQTMEIPYSALDAHLKHGDYIGSCDAPPDPKLNEGGGNSGNSDCMELNCHGN